MVRERAATSNQSLWSSVSQSDFHKLCTLHGRLLQQETGTGFSTGIASVTLQTCFAKEHYFFILFYCVLFGSTSTDGKSHEFWSAGTCLNLQEFPDCVVLGARLEPGSSRVPSPCCLVSTGSWTYDHTCFGVWGRVQNNKFTWAFLKERCSQMPTAITTETLDCDPGRGFPFRRAQERLYIWVTGKVKPWGGCLPFICF